MDQLLKLNAMHKLIMGEIAAEAVIESGVMWCGWERGEHIQHTSDALETQVQRFQRQTRVVFQHLDEENLDFVKKSLETYMRDRENLAFNLKHDKIHRALFGVVANYINQLNEIISVLADFVKNAEGRQV